MDFTFLFNAEKFQRWSDEMNNEGFDPNDDLGYHYMKGGILPTISSNDEYRTGDALMARLFYSYDNRYMIYRYGSERWLFCVWTKKSSGGIPLSCCRMGIL